MAETSSLNIKVGVQGADRAQGKLRGVGESASGAGRGAANAGMSFQKMAVGIGAALAAGRMIIGVAQKWIQMAQRQELAERKLAKALELGGNAADDASERWLRFASELQRVTAVGDEATIELMTLATTMGATEEQLESVTVAATGLNKSFGMKMEQAVQIATMAINGNYSMLGRYAPKVREATTETEKAAAAQEFLRKAFITGNEAMGTTVGQTESVSGRIDDLQEKLGTLLLPVLEAIIGKIEEFVTGLELTAGAIGKVFKGDFAGAWDTIRGKVDETTRSTEELADTIKLGSDESQTLFRSVAVINEELKAAREEFNNAKSAAMETAALAEIARLEAELAARTGKDEKDQTRKPPVVKQIELVAGSIAEMESRLREFQESQKNAVAGSEEWQTATLNIARTREELQRLQQVANAMTGEGPDAKGIPPFTQVGIDIANMATVAAPALDTTISLLDRMALVMQENAQVASNVAAAIGVAFSENFAVMKGIAIAETVINTAKGIMAASPNIPLMASIGVLGAAQLAKIISTKPGSAGGGAPSVPSGIAQEGRAPTGGGPPVRRLSLSGGSSTRVEVVGELVERDGALHAVIQHSARNQERGGI